MDLLPHVVAVPLAEHTVMHLQALLDLGALEGPRGGRTMNPRLRPLVDAMYHVLAGGSAQVAVTAPGDPTIFNDLSTKETMCVRALNEINGKYQFPLVIEV